MLADDNYSVFAGDRCSLIFDKVNQADKGMYKVVARNAYGEAASECTLHVEGRLSFMLNLHINIMDRFSVYIYCKHKIVIEMKCVHTRICMACLILALVVK